MMSSATPHRSTRATVLLLGFLSVMLWGSAPASAQSFTNCITSDDVDKPASSAVVVVPTDVVSSLPDGVVLETGDEIALLTADGVCAGVDTYDGTSNTAITVYGPGDSNLGTRTGFTSGEAMRYRVWDVSAATEYEVGERVAYRSCDASSSLCRDVNTYANGAIHTVDQMGDASLLPVELSQFGATLNGAQAVLQWVTATETNNAGFEVQRRGPEGDAFQTLGFVKGAGTTTEAQTYRYTSDPLDVGTHDFRLVQVDLDGTATVIEPVTVDVAMDRAVSFSTVAPNPIRTQGRMTIRLQTSQKVSIHVYNVLGQRVRTLHDGTLPSGTDHVFRLDASALPSGVYFVRLRAASFTETRRVVVVR